MWEAPTKPGQPSMVNRDRSRLVLLPPSAIGVNPSGRHGTLVHPGRQRPLRTLTVGAAVDKSAALARGAEGKASEQGCCDATHEDGGMLHLLD